MAATFDRETLLDLVVNVIPLAIILFFVVAFAVVQPFGGDRLGAILMYVLLLAPFVALAVLTYVSGKVIVADEQRGELFHQGQAPMDDATPREQTDGSPADEASVGSEAASPDSNATDSNATDSDGSNTADSDSSNATDSNDSDGSNATDAEA